MGSVKVMVLPLCRLESIVIDPPTAEARSCMPTMPRLPGGRTLGLKPWPLSASPPTSAPKPEEPRIARDWHKKVKSRFGTRKLVPVWVQLGKMSGRLRKNIFGDRQRVALRIPNELHTKLMSYCNQHTIAANTFIVDAIEEALSRSNPKWGLGPHMPIRGAGAARVSVTIRIPEDLRQRMTGVCDAAGISSAAFAIAVLGANLRRQR